MFRDIQEQLTLRLLGRIPLDRAFVFGIGLSKTGTTSLNDALGLLGYRAYHMPPITNVSETGISLDAPWWIWKYDALTDLSPAVLYRTLDSRFPNARFIYTRRDLDGWLSSCRRHFTEDLAAARVAQGNEWMNDLCDAFYGNHVFEESGYRLAYETHEKEVMEHFQGRKNFMSYDLTAGEGWAPLCNFLEVDLPPSPFPRSNVGKST